MLTLFGLPMMHRVSVIVLTLIVTFDSHVWIRLNKVASVMISSLLTGRICSRSNCFVCFVGFVYSIRSVSVFLWRMFLSSSPVTEPLLHWKRFIYWLDSESEICLLSESQKQHRRFRLKFRNDIIFKSILIFIDNFFLKSHYCKTVI